MAKHSANQSLADILENIEKAQGYLVNVALAEFCSSDEKQQAVLHRLQSASEALSRLKREWPDRYDEVRAAIATELALSNIPEEAGDGTAKGD